ncbi:hypothetical protein CANCADRAFT_58551 [Tortispora caseinolytica NRRL Y-17796]|uniref:Protein BIG1 n=1 Tax=Tortispora caseinolytica NRRL Y-17796 TaxID=767744 RepID=A0A1E4TD36_9ASCO|nr:hypothetical protein CANCADRAFT_58551 [Tortispora caseinolytica NRRL Y-17796]
MRTLSVGLLFALNALTVFAIGDSSPFFVFGYKEQLSGSPKKGNYMINTTEFQELVESHTAECDFDAYILVHQPHLHLSDIIDSNSMPHSSQALKVSPISHIAANVVGEYDVSGVRDQLAQRCGAKVIQADASSGSFNSFSDKQPRVITLDFEPLATDKETRAKQILSNDAVIFNVLSSLPSKNAIVVFSSTPLESPNMVQSNEGGHAEAIRVATPPKNFRRSDKQRPPKVDRAHSGLFSKYSFVSAGILMGFFVVVTVLAIVYVGLSVISGMSVSYSAFEKQKTS